MRIVFDKYHIVTSNIVLIYDLSWCLYLIIHILLNSTIKYIEDFGLTCFYIYIKHTSSRFCITILICTAVRTECVHSNLSLIFKWVGHSILDIILILEKENKLLRSLKTYIFSILVLKKHRGPTQKR